MARAAGAAGFPHAARLRRPPEFARVFAARQSAAAGPLVLYAAPAAAAGRPRLGLSVSSRIGNAVVRNRWKRRLREAFRHVQERLPTGNDFVVVVRGGATPEAAAGARRMEEAIVELASRVVGRPGYAAFAARRAAEAAAAGPPRRRRR